MANWFDNLEPVAQGAVITATVTLTAAIATAISTTINILLKDRLDRRLEKSRRDESIRDTYRKYADPLTTSATSLFWRLREVFVGGGGYYLTLGGGETRYERYKTESTRFRVAALLGWMTALQRELVLCDAQPDASVSSMRSAINGLQHSLAEGGHVEVERVQLLCAQWARRMDSAQEAEVGRQIDSVLKRALLRAGEHGAPTLELEAQQELATEVHSVLVALTDPDDQAEPVQPPLEEIVRVLSIREAWLYRDWQTAVGEMMLEQPAGAARRFDVKGYRAFSEIAADENASDHVWIERLSELTEDLDVSGDGRYDARIGQLRGVFVALAQLIVDFHEAEPTHSSVGDQTLVAARAVIRDAASDIAAPPSTKRRGWKRAPKSPR